MVTFLGAVTTGHADLLAAGRASLETMRAHQSKRGLIQLNVNPDTGYVSTENAGAVDGNLWYILGHYLYFQVTGDLTPAPAVPEPMTASLAGLGFIAMLTRRRRGA